MTMIKSHKFKAAFLGGIGIALAASLSGQIEYDREEFWNQPSIKRYFLESYEPLTDLEPRPSEEEAIVLKQFQELYALPETQDQAKQVVFDAIALQPGPVLYFMAGSIEAESGNIDKAIPYYEKAIEAFPRFRRVRRNIGLMYVRNGNWDKVIEHYSKVIELGGQDAIVHGLLGLSYINQDKAISAETSYRNAVVLDPKTKDWKLGLAKALLAQSKWKEAIAVLDEILIEEPENEIIWLSQSNAYIGLEELDKAVANQEIVDRLGKSTPESLELMGNIYSSQGLGELAIKYYQKAIKAGAKQPVSTHIGIAELLVGRGSMREAGMIAAQIRKARGDRIGKEDDTRLLRLESQVALATDQGEKVIPILRRLIENDPMDGKALIMLGGFYTQQDTIDGYASADIYYERAIKIPEEEYNGLIKWARSFVSRERYDKAIPLIERANTLKPQEHITRYLDQVRRIHIRRLNQ